MAAEIITKEDFEQFEERLINQIKVLLGNRANEPKKWLKSYQVRNLLKIPPGHITKFKGQWYDQVHQDRWDTLL